MTEYKQYKWCTCRASSWCIVMNGIVKIQYDGKSLTPRAVDWDSCLNDKTWHHMTVREKKATMEFVRGRV